MKTLCLILIASICLFSNTIAQTWIPDSLFGHNSSLIVNAGGSEDFSNFLRQSDGKIVAGGYDSDSSYYYHNIMIRFDQCGLIDSAFGMNGIVGHRFDQRNMGRNYALQADGKFLCAGIQAPGNAGSQQIPFVARYNPDGSVDTNFANAGTHALRFDLVSSGTFYTVIPMANGRILCGGTSSANANGGVHGMGAMRFMSDGSLDTTFDTDGKTRYAINTSYCPARARLLQNGNIIVAGRYLDAGSNAHFVAVCFDSTGVLDTTFAVAGVFTDTVNLKYIYADAYMDMQSDEKIVMACTREPDTEGIEVIRFTSSGILDTTFGINGHVNLTFTAMECRGIKLLSSGKIMVMGKTNNVVGSVAQLLASGAIDSAFATNGYLSIDLYPGGSDYVGDAIELPNNRLLFGGGDIDNNMKRYITQSNVPHITGNASLLQTTGTGTYQWFLNDTAISGATASTYVPLLNGSYTVELTDDLGCTYLSDVFILNVGVNEMNSLLNTISILTNPFNHFLEFAVSAPMAGKISCELSDVTGKLIFTGALEFNTAGKHKIEIPGLDNGMYFIVFNHKNSRRLLKVLKIDNK